jgi:hypothetical protein
MNICAALVADLQSAISEATQVDRTDDAEIFVLLLAAMLI